MQIWIGYVNFLLIFILIIAGLYFSFRTKFVQLSAIKETFRLMTGKEKNKSDYENKGVSSFQAFAMSTASRVGTGNLAGVAIAISLGGPGAVFWMWLIAIIGAASGFVESTLAQVYKVRNGNHFKGGPAYYIQQALRARWLGIIFSILIIISFGFAFNCVQANTVSSSFQDMFDVNPFWMGIILAAFVIPTIFGGVQRIAKVTATVVPIMALAYMVIALVVILINFEQIPGIFLSIVKSAFGFNEMLAGGAGAAIENGVKRGLFSNEAGMGSAPNAAATAHVNHPVKQGLVQSFGVFVDTLFICSATALIILFSGISTAGKHTGIQLMQHALASQVGAWAHIFIGLAVFVFAFTAITGNYYYGQSNLEFITKKKGWILIYRIAVVVMIVGGSVAKLELVWQIADLCMISMALINLIVIMLLGKVAFLALEHYMKQRKLGEEPVFYEDVIPGLKQTECWQRN